MSLKYFILTLLLTFSAFADEPTNSESQTSAPVVAKTSRFHDDKFFQIGALHGYFDTYENDRPSQTGSLQGFIAKSSFRFYRDPLLVSAELEYLAGPTDFKGQTTRGENVTARSNDALGSLKFLASYAIDEPVGSFRPFLGFAGASWQNKVQTEGGYGRTHTRLYTVAGLEFRKDLSEKNMIILAAEYDYLNFGSVESRLSHVDAALPDVTNKISNGYGLRVSAQDLLVLSENMSAFFQAYYQYWNLEASDSVSLATNVSYNRPASTSNLLGLTAGLIF